MSNKKKALKLGKCVKKIAKIIGVLIVVAVSLVFGIMVSIWLQIYCGFI